MKNMRAMAIMTLGVFILTVMAGCTPIDGQDNKEPSFGEQFGQQLVDSLINSVEQSMEEKLNFSYPVKKEFREQQIHKLVNEQVSKHLGGIDW